MYEALRPSAGGLKLLKLLVYEALRPSAGGLKLLPASLANKRPCTFGSLLLRGVTSSGLGFRV